MNQISVEQVVEKMVEELIAGTEFSLVDIEYVKEREWYLRVYLDKEGGIGLDDCQMISRELEARLDKMDTIKESYYLEVSSPGLDRPLKKEKDFERHQGQKIDIHLYAPWQGNKLWTGTLSGLNAEGDVMLDTSSGLLTIPKGQISIVKLHIDF